MFARVLDNQEMLICINWYPHNKLRGTFFPRAYSVNVFRPHGTEYAQRRFPLPLRNHIPPKITFSLIFFCCFPHIKTPSVRQDTSNKHNNLQQPFKALCLCCCGAKYTHEEEERPVWEVNGAHYHSVLQSSTREILCHYCVPGNNR